MNTTHTQHTPGPWQYHLGRGANPRFHVQTSGGYQIASTTELCRHSQAYEENASREANARLIAAAPELVEALRVLVTDADKTGGHIRNVHRVDIDRARALLARIEGGAE